MAGGYRLAGSALEDQAMNEVSPIQTQSVTTLPTGSAPAASAKIGVLLVNLGTPDTADAAGVRRYLREFLTDPRVIENQGPLWDIVLNTLLLPIRPL
jgi:ferrochelatase